jgi:hypothetical protein
MTFRAWLDCYLEGYADRVWNWTLELWGGYTTAAASGIGIVHDDDARA